MVTTLGTGYQFAGVATTATNPGSPDAKVFYIANGKGTYTNFGGINVTEDDVVVLYWDTAWHKEATGIASNEKLSELNKQIVYDVTANNGGVKFNSISALLSSENLSTLIPDGMRCGGMSIRFVQSSDNKYVQYTLMKSIFSTYIGDWQSIGNSKTLGNLLSTIQTSVESGSDKIKIELPIPITIETKKYYIEIIGGIDVYELRVMNRNSINLIPVVNIRNNHTLVEVPADAYYWRFDYYPIENTTNITVKFYEDSLLYDFKMFEEETNEAIYNKVLANKDTVVIAGSPNIRLDTPIPITTEEKKYKVTVTGIDVSELWIKDRVFENLVKCYFTNNEAVVDIPSGARYWFFDFTNTPSSDTNITYEIIEVGISERLEILENLNPEDVERNMFSHKINTVSDTISSGSKNITISNLIPSFYDDKSDDYYLITIDSDFNVETLQIKSPDNSNLYIINVQENKVILNKKVVNARYYRFNGNQVSSNTPIEVNVYKLGAKEFVRICQEEIFRNDIRCKFETGGLLACLNNFKSQYIDENNVWASGDSTSIIIPLSLGEGSILEIQVAYLRTLNYSFLRSLKNAGNNGTEPDFCSNQQGRITTSNNGKPLLLEVPADAKWILFNGATEYINIFAINGTDYKTLVKEKTVVSKNILQEESIKLQNINKGYYENATSQLVLQWFSDVHGNEYNIKRVLAYYNKYSDYINDIIHTGDLAPSTFIDLTTDPIGSINGFNKVLQVIGNHDIYISSDGQEPWKSFEDVYKSYFKDIADWGVTQPNGAGENGYFPCYYLKDYPSAKMRLIVLDCMRYDATQKAWFKSVLAETLDSNNAAYGYHVICAQHIIDANLRSDTSLITPFDTPFNSLENIIYSSYIAEGMANDVDDFINAGGVFACWMLGHTHQDYCGVLTNHPKQIYIIVGTASYKAPFLDSSRDIENRSVDLFNIIGFDYITKTVKMMRVGGMFDRYMRKRESICFQYGDNPKILFTS